MTSTSILIYKTYTIHKSLEPIGSAQPSSYWPSKLNRLKDHETFVYKILANE